MKNFKSINLFNPSPVLYCDEPHFVDGEISEVLSVDPF